jgi:transposase InsO family protein
MREYRRRKRLTHETRESECIQAPMPIKRYKAEQIVTLLRQIEAGIANGEPTPQACKEAEITQQTYYGWRKRYGGLELDQAKRRKELEGKFNFFYVPSQTNSIYTSPRWGPTIN